LVRRFGSLLRAYELASYTPELRQGDLHRSSFDFGSGG
jgi:hypothetical protein